MRLVDLNILIYATNRDAASHREARAWLEQMLSGNDLVAFSWMVLLGFLRITTHPGIFSTPLRTDQAVGIVDQWMTLPNVVILVPGEGHWRIVKDLLTEAGTGGNLTTDAHLAALAIEHGCTLSSTDRDFSRFRRLNWETPFR